MVFALSAKNNPHIVLMLNHIKINPLKILDLGFYSHIYYLQNDVMCYFSFMIGISSLSAINLKMNMIFHIFGERVKASINREPILRDVGRVMFHGPDFSSIKICSLRKVCVLCLLILFLHNVIILKIRLF